MKTISKPRSYLLPHQITRLEHDIILLMKDYKTRPSAVEHNATVYSTSHRMGLHLRLLHGSEPRIQIHLNEILPYIYKYIITYDIFHEQLEEMVMKIIKNLFPNIPTQII